MELFKQVVGIPTAVSSLIIDYLKDSHAVTASAGPDLQLSILSDISNSPKPSLAASNNCRLPLLLTLI